MMEISNRTKLVIAIVLPLLLVAIPVGVLVLGIGRSPETVFRLKDYSGSEASLRDVSLTVDRGQAVMEGNVEGLGDSEYLVSMGLQLESSEGSQDMELEVPMGEGDFALCFVVEGEVDSCSLDYMEISGPAGTSSSNGYTSRRDSDDSESNGERTDGVDEGEEADGRSGEDSAQEGDDRRADGDSGMLPGHEDVPLPPNSELVSRQGSMSQGGEYFEYRTPYSIDEVTAFYSNQMESYGWSLDSSEMLPGQGMSSFSQGTKMLLLEVGAEGEETLFRLAIMDLTSPVPGY